MATNEARTQEADQEDQRAPPNSAINGDRPAKSMCGPFTVAVPYSQTWFGPQASGA